MDVKHLTIVNLEEVTKEEFAPYGQIWGREEGEPLEALDNLKFYAYEAQLEPAVEMVETGLLICNAKGREIRYFERHPETSETFIPIEGQCIFVMAPGDDGKTRPEADRIRAFYLSGSLGVSLTAGNWHWPPIPLGKQVKLLLIRKGSHSDPCDTVALQDMGLEGIRVVL